MRQSFHYCGVICRIQIKGVVLALYTLKDLMSFILIRWAFSLAMTHANKLVAGGFNIPHLT
jgi:hypothetical protein